MVGLGDLPGGFFRSAARAVSADGSAVAGIGGKDGPSGEAFYWTSTGGMQGLGDLPGGSASSDAYGVSADGGVVVGQGRSASGGEAFRWTEADGMMGLGDLPGGDFSSLASDISSDGSTVVGRSLIGPEDFEAFRWTEAGGMVGLGHLPGGVLDSQAIAVSSDGSVVVGEDDTASGKEAFRWTSAGGMVGLGDLPGGTFESEASGVSADGRIVVGNSRTTAGDEFFVWTQANGMQRLQEILEADGTTGLSGWSSLRAGGISDNGRWVTGVGINPSGFQEAFLVQLPDTVIPGFKINAGINDAWFNADTAGQGFFIIAFPDLKFMFLAWFTFETSLPDESIIANLGWAGHRWFTAGGFYSGDTAELEIEFTSGGVFDSIEPKVDQVQGGGTITVKFSDCENATVTYDIPSIARMDVVPIKRGLPDNVALCKELNQTVR
jgi:probable HAF family extracellular repeat protein